MGGSAGGGGSQPSGASDYPIYMKKIHANWLNHSSYTDGVGDNIDLSVVDLMNTTMAGGSPFAGMVTSIAADYPQFKAIDPEKIFFATGAGIASYRTPFEMLRCFDRFDIDTTYTNYKPSYDTEAKYTALRETYDTNAAYTGFLSDDTTRLTNIITAADTLQTDLMNTNNLPAFQQGMANINAVMSSAFVIGNALILDSKTKAITHLDAEMRYKRLTDGTIHALDRVKTEINWKNISADMALRRVATGINWLQTTESIALGRNAATVEWRRLITTMSAEFARLYAATKSDIDGHYLDVKAKDAIWDIELYQYGANILSSISGSALSKGYVPSSRSTMGGALSGALSGGATGAMMMPANPVLGAAGGAAIGLAASLL